MRLLPLFFICVKIFYFINTRSLAMAVEKLTFLLENRDKNKTHLIVIDNTTFYIILYFFCDILYLLYCIHLISRTETWQPGCLLLYISILESFAVRFKISGAHEVDIDGLVYPKDWLRYLSTGLSMFILLHIFEGVI